MFGFVLQVTLPAPLGFGGAQVDSAAEVAFNDASPGVLLIWNSTIYILNALALAVLVVALSRALADTPAWAAVTQGSGLIWAALVLGAGMMANVTLKKATLLVPRTPRPRPTFGRFCTLLSLGLAAGTRLPKVSGSDVSALPVILAEN